MDELSVMAVELARNYIASGSSQTLLEARDAIGILLREAEGYEELVRAALNTKLVDIEPTHVQARHETASNIELVVNFASGPEPVAAPAPENFQPISLREELVRRGLEPSTRRRGSVEIRANSR